MSLSRLQELSTLVEAKTVTEEAPKRSMSKDVAGIASVVNDCLEDLADKVGSGGTLSNMVRDLKYSKKDDPEKAKSTAEAKELVRTMAKLTTDYVKAMTGPMAEVELLMMHLAESEEHDGEVLAEAKDYDDSSDFTEEFYTIREQTIKMKAIMKNPRWMAWMKATDTNFGTDTQTPARAAILSVDSLAANLNDLEDELDNAQ